MFPDRSTSPARLSRRALAAAIGLVGVAAVRPRAWAQEITVITPNSGESARIVSTQLGEVPTTGARRPGPFDQPALAAQRAPGLVPLTLTVPAIGIDAQIEPLLVIDGVMQDPTGPWAIAWYRNLEALGEGAEVTVTAEDGQIFTYAVEWVRQYEADALPLDEVVGATSRECLTLITCGGTFDYATAHYLHRTVVRALQVATEPANGGA